MGRKKKDSFFKKIILALFLVLIYFYNQEYGMIDFNIPENTPENQEITEYNRYMEVYFCPEEDCAGELIELIESANESIYCAIYDVEREDVLDALTEKSKSVDFGLVTDKDNSEQLTEFEFVQNDGTNQLMHNKFCIIDSEIVFTGSYNPTITGMANNNNMLIIYSSYISQNYLEEYKELSGRTFGAGDAVKYPVVTLNDRVIENYFCPEDGCASHVIDVISSANESIEFMTFSFTNDDIGDAVIERYNSGVDVRGVFEKFQRSQWSEFQKMADDGIDVRWDSNPKNMHNKVFIVDGEVVVTGSFNPTKAADTKNDENILIIYDAEIASEYSQSFEQIYNAYTTE